MSAVRIGRRRVELSNQDKVLFPESGLTKGDLVAHYRDVAPAMLRHLADRPLALQRFPDGIGAGGFYQKQVASHFPDWIGRVRVTTEQGPQVHCVCNDTATLVYLADQACVTLHCWASRGDRLDRPDRLVIDLDPELDVFAAVVDAARQVRAVLEDCGLVPFVQTTGSRGVHVVTPLTRDHDFEETRAFATGVARLLVARDPDRLTRAQRKRERHGRLYLDVARNAYGQTGVAPYSVRAKPGAPVATPVDWDELGTRVTHAGAFTVESVRRRLRAREDAWKGMGRRARSLARPWRRLRALLRDAGADAEQA